VSSEALHRVAHMPPKWRRSISDLRGELPTVTGYVLPKVEAGKIRAPASFAGVGNLTKDAGEQRKPSFRRSSASDVAMSSQDRTSS
jgi:hypothetical protein